MDAGVIVLLMVFIFAPNLSEVLARMFSYDKFYHIDGFLFITGVGSSSWNDLE